jgi:dihydroxy-acid dehydratase
MMTVTGKTLAENLRDVPDGDREVIRSYGNPMKEAAGYVVMSGNLFDSAVMKISVIDQEFRRRFLSNPARPNVFEGKATSSRTSTMSPVSTSHTCQKAAGCDHDKPAE